jgi:CheY-like chemotaxis protein
VDAKRHQLTINLPAENLRLEADPLRLSQVIGNLLTNAAKYTEPGGRIGVHVARDGDRVIATISDDGMGIAPDMLSRIFDLFVQAPQTIDRSRGGLGLGLTIVQSLVSSFGGAVQAHSAGAGQGSRFVVSLPALDAAPPAAAWADSAPVGREGAGRRVHRILVVDDNTDALEMLADALRLLGHEPATAGDGVAALALAPSVKPRLALLDIGLPGMDGYELGRRLRELPGLESLELVALTGYGQASDRERSRAAGFSQHLVKPVELVAIEKLLANLDA